MDELTLFRTTHEDVQLLEGEKLQAGRNRLLQQIRPQPSGKLRGRPRLRAIQRIGFATLATGVAASVLIGTNLIGPAGLFGGADPAAATVLEAAAVTAIASSDPVVSAGQYLVVRSETVFPTSGQIADGTVGEYLYRSASELYIPADKSAEWVWVQNQPTIEQTFGPSSAVVAQGWIDAIRRENGTDADVVSSHNGEFNNAPRYVDARLLEELPRDPRMLLNYIYRVTLGTGPSADGEALVYIADVLRSGVVPAEMRAAFYRAAALIPGVTVTDKQATLDGRSGIAIGRYESKWTSRQEIIIDPDTGLLIGEREVSYATDWDIPPGTVSKWTSVITTVEDSAPGKKGKL